MAAMATTPAPDERGTTHASHAAHAVAAAVKPRLRGWLHAGMVPLTVAAGIVLIALAPTTPARIAAAVFSVTAWLLFGTSAVYHRGNWSPRVAGVLKRLDHSTSSSSSPAATRRSPSCSPTTRRRRS